MSLNKDKMIHYDTLPKTNIALKVGQVVSQQNHGFQGRLAFAVGFGECQIGLGFCKIMLQNDQFY